ncbi:TRAP transporter large permease subunit, partial [Pantoea sp. SIMBA_133]
PASEALAQTGRTPARPGAKDGLSGVNGTPCLTALACLILGMEVPTTAAYVICVSVAGPALISLGLEPLLAHLFVFWYALLSTITPPVCGGVFIAAGMV